MIGVMVPSVFGDESPYDIIEANLNKLFVEKHEIISVEGKVRNFDPNFKSVTLILETKEGHLTDWDTAPVNPDGSFEKSWGTGSNYSGTWGESGIFVLTIWYGFDEFSKKIEFTYCDKTYPHHPRYLEHCQDAYGEVKPISTIENIDEQKTQTITQDGMELAYTGKDPTGSDLWVESEESYNQRIIYPLIFQVIAVIAIIIIIVIVIYKAVKNRKKF